MPAAGNFIKSADVNATLLALINDYNLLVGNNKLAGGSVDGLQLATTAISLGYAPATSSFSTSSLTAVQVTGLTIPVTIPAGGRNVKITAFVSNMLNNTVNDGAVLTIWDGTVGSGTQLSRAFSGTASNASQSIPAIAMAVVTAPAAGAKTYNVGLNADTGGTATISAAAAFPAFILVELI